MANDRFYARCTICGDYLFLGKFYPSTGAYFVSKPRIDALGSFIESHLTNCQPSSAGFDGPICVVIDSEETLCAAGGMIGGSGNVNLDKETRITRPG